MNPRTCQLCGKPLSRLRVGSDGDFCSKEHRNQFRLRRGMDRLVEVNKVASLMRRRENPRQIAFNRLMCQSAITPRGFSQPQPTHLHTTPFRYYPEYQSFETPHITAHAEHFLQAPPSLLPGHSSRRKPNDGAVKIRARSSELELPAARCDLEAHVAPAPACRLRHGSGARPRHREYNLLRRSGIRVDVGKGPAAFRRVRFSGTEALRHGVRLVKPASMAVVGNALRVSIGRGFKLPAMELRTIQTNPVLNSALKYPQRAMTLAPPMSDTGSRSRISPVSSTAILMRLPRSPRGALTSTFVYPGTLPPSPGTAMIGTFPAARSTGFTWTPPGARWNPHAIEPPEAGFAKRNGAHLLRVPMLPTRVSSNKQVTFAPFIPQEPMGCPVVQFQGTIAGASPTVVPVTELPQPEPAPAAAPPVATLVEEHFDAGWDNWVGGVADWKVDVAGVRTGAMALFIPTLDLSDYDLEFFARIDHRTLNWVVRAAGLEEHVRCTLTVMPGNELEFSHTVVRGGNAEPAVTAATKVSGKPRATVTVRTEVKGNSFAVAVDGKTIDTWTDSRLTSGGVGFTGTPDDRARLYWVRVASSQITGKE